MRLILRDSAIMDCCCLSPPHWRVCGVVPVGTCTVTSLLWALGSLIFWILGSWTKSAQTPPMTREAAGGVGKGFNSGQFVTFIKPGEELPPGREPQSVCPGSRGN